jgi:hypothetical protein
LNRFIRWWWVIKREEMLALGILVGAFLLALLLHPGGLGYENVERITWVDWRGRTRTVEIHRRAEWV